MLVCSKLLGPSSLELYKSTKELEYNYGYYWPLSSNKSIILIFIKKLFFGNIAFLVIQNLSFYSKINCTYMLFDV